MIEKVNTGGMISFVYPKGYKNSELSWQEKEGIREAYRKAGERKRKERIRKIILYISAIIILIATIYINYSQGH